MAVARFGREPALVVEHEQALVPEFEIDTESDPLHVKVSRGQGAPRGRQRATRALRVVAREQAPVARLPGPGLRLHVIPVDAFREHARTGRQEPEAVTVASRVLE